MIIRKFMENYVKFVYNIKIKYMQKYNLDL